MIIFHLLLQRISKSHKSLQFSIILSIQRNIFLANSLPLSQLTHSHSHASQMRFSILPGTQSRRKAGKEVIQDQWRKVVCKFLRVSRQNWGVCNFSLLSLKVHRVQARCVNATCYIMLTTPFLRRSCSFIVFSFLGINHIFHSSNELWIKFNLYLVLTTMLRTSSNWSFYAERRK